MSFLNASKNCISFIKFTRKQRLLGHESIDVLIDRSSQCLPPERDINSRSINNASARAGEIHELIETSNLKIRNLDEDINSVTALDVDTQKKYTRQRMVPQQDSLELIDRNK